MMLSALQRSPGLQQKVWRPHHEPMSTAACNVQLQRHGRPKIAYSSERDYRRAWKRQDHRHLQPAEAEGKWAM